MPASITGTFDYPLALVIHGMMMQEIERFVCPCARCCSRNIATTLLASDGHEHRCDTCGFTWREPYLRLKRDRRVSHDAC